MDGKTAIAWAGFALLLNLLGIIATAVSAQFLFSAMASFVALVPVLAARGTARVFAIIVLVGSVALTATGYGKFAQDPYMQRVGASR